MDRGAWWATVHRVSKTQTVLKRLRMRACVCTDLSPLSFIQSPLSCFLWQIHFLHVSFLTIIFLKKNEYIFVKKFIYAVFVEG